MRKRWIMPVAGAFALAISLMPLTASVVASEATILVAPGDTLTAIAARHGTSVAWLASLNGLADPNRILAGQRLIIPAAAPPPPAAPAPAAASRHLVQPGETLTALALRYLTTVDALATVNGLADPSFIIAGTTLTIPPPTPGDAAAPGRTATPPLEAASPAAAPGISTLIAERSAVRDLIVAEAGRQGVPAALALAVAWHESGWQQGVISSAGAVGIMQLLPATGEWVGVVMLGEPVDIASPEANVRAGVRLLHHYLDRYAGDPSRVLAAYYQGQRAVDEFGIYPETHAYIASVQALELLFAE